MTPQTPATAEIEKWLRIRVLFFTNFWLRIRVRQKTPESCWSRRRNSGSMVTSTGNTPEVAGVTFSDSTPVRKF